MQLGVRPWDIENDEGLPTLTYAELVPLVSWARELRKRQTKKGS